MTTQLEDDKYLTIQLLSFDRPTGLTERYYFLEMSTLQATTLIPKDKRIISTKIVAYTDDNKYLNESTADGFKNIGDFNSFFLNNPDYYIHNCDIELEGGLIIHSHDDGEVSVLFSNVNQDRNLLELIFKKYNLDTSIVELLKSKPGHYIAIDKDSNITGDFVDFDDYIENGRK
jgi:hypothetical protein